MALLEIFDGGDDDLRVKIEEELKNIGRDYEFHFQKTNMEFDDRDDAYAVADEIKKKFGDEIECSVSF